MSEPVVDNFHKRWHQSIDGTWHLTRWRGVKALKCPMDMWVYQELIASIRPALIIETGTCFGGSALFLADMCQLQGRGKVITVDIQAPRNPPKHPRLTYYRGSSTDLKTIAHLRRLVRSVRGPVMVILDSDHSKQHVYRELQLYTEFVTVGSYMIVEDMSLGRLVREDHGPGPADAVEQYLENYDHYVVDKKCERYLMTFNEGGYLRRVK